MSIDIKNINLSADVPLDAFIRRISRMVEQWFGQTGEILPLWIVVQRDGAAYVIGTPFFADASDPYGDAAKATIAEDMRRHFAEHDVIRYAHLAEAWMTERSMASSKEILAGKVELCRPRVDPAGKEVITIYAQDGGGALNGVRDIIRPRGGKSYLGKLDLCPGGGGRFGDLLPQPHLH